MDHKNYCQNCLCRLTVTRNPNQRYCNQPSCQKRRKNLWRQAKRIQDPDYKSNQQKANRCWQQSHQNYWRGYRMKHPDYVNRNREMQKARDRARLPRDKGASHLAKSDADRVKIIIESGTYRLIPLEHHLAKSDAFTAKIDIITDTYLEYRHPAHLAKRPPYSQSSS
jgi:hypothetical protein